MLTKEKGIRLGQALLALLLVVALLMPVIPANYVLAEDVTYDVGEYKGDKEQAQWTYPTQEGKAFAGWYADAAFETPYTETTGQAYAKFVDSALLGVKKQLGTGATLASETVKIRFVTAIDSLDYASVTFDVKVPDLSKSWALKETTAYTSILVSEKTTLPSDVFGSEAKYFVLHSLTGIPKAAYEAGFEVNVVWETLDGTLVSSAQANTFTVKELIAGNCTHVDADPKDHICDACGTTGIGGACADGDDANHTCDYCGGEVEGEVCVDDDKNHACDECNGNVGTHADGDDANHTCDYCGGAVEGEECVDTNDDNLCDECGAADPDYVAPAAPVAPTESTDSRWIYQNAITNSNWSPAFNDNDAYDENANKISVSDGKLQITDDSSTRVSAIRGLKELTGEVVIEFEVSSTALSTGSALLFDIRGKNADNQEKQAIDVRLFSDGVDCYTTKSNKVAGTYAADTTYKVQIVADVESQTYDVFVDGKLTHENVEMRNTVTSLSKIRLWTTTKALAATVTYENLKIYYLNAVCTHTNTELRNDKAATCGAAGYTGDTYCVDCDELVTQGEAIEATGNHNYVKGVCDVCGAEDSDYVAPPVAPTEDTDSRWIYKNALTDGGTWTYLNTDDEANTASLSDGKLQITDDANTVVSAHRGVKGLTGEVVIEFEVSSTELSKNSGLYFVLRQGTGNPAVDVRMFSDRVECWYTNETGDPTAEGTKVSGTYEANKPYKVQIVADVTANTYSVFIDDVLILKDVKMRNAVTQLSNVRFYTTLKDLAATVTYENLKIYYLNEQTAE